VATRKTLQYATGYLIEKGLAIENVFVWITIFTYCARVLSPLALVLVLVEARDVIFAVDSLPAMFAVTSDSFVVFTANTFAILGLRAMYVMLADMADCVHLLGYGLATVVSLVGVKMLVMEWYNVPVHWMLGTVAVVLAVSVVASLLVRRPPYPHATQR